jgi:hypothetical protein
MHEGTVDDMKMLTNATYLPKNTFLILAVCVMALSYNMLS